MQLRLRGGLLAMVAVAAIAVSGTGVAVAAGPGPVAGGPAGAGTCATQSSAARTSGGVAILRAFGDCEIDRRLTTLGQLDAAVGGSRGLTAADSAALSGDIAAARAGLTTLRATVDSQTALPALRLEIVEMVTKYRVYLLLGPQVRLVAAADDVVALGPHMSELSTTLANRIAAAKASGRDVSSAQASLDAMNGQIASSQSLASPLPAQLLALTPVQYDAGTVGPALQNARTAVTNARDALKAAVTDGRAVLAALK